jgi:uncharacterized protein DUF6508
MEELIAFLPRLYADGFSPVVSWAGGQKREDGSFSLPYPDYDPLVTQFFRAVSGGGWLDHGYDPEQAWQMIRDETLIKRASLAEIKVMLTFCVRGERFSDGHWAEMIEKGYVRQLLERLAEIKAEQFER